MSSVSVGSGTANDSNENHPQDHTPSKTLGAEGGGQDPAAALTPTGQPLDFSASDGDMLGKGDSAGTDSDASGADKPAPFEGVLDPDAYPDGPNVEASPWELDAARGKTTGPGT